MAKHDWEDALDPGDPASLMMDPHRRCRLCGAEQRYITEYLWMRPVRSRWLPLVGRCPGGFPEH